MAFARVLKIISPKYKDKEQTRAQHQLLAELHPAEKSLFSQTYQPMLPQ
jgi:tRNA A37 N6-isopentenylltransferase MiaA